MSLPALNNSLEIVWGRRVSVTLQIKRPDIRIGPVEYHITIRIFVEIDGVVFAPANRTGKRDDVCRVVDGRDLHRCARADPNPICTRSGPSWLKSMCVRHG